MHTHGMPTHGTSILFVAAMTTVLCLADRSVAKGPSAADGPSASDPTSAADGPSTTDKSSAADTTPAADREAETLHQKYLKRFKPLAIESETAWWVAATTGTDEAFKRRTAAQTALIELNSDRNLFNQVRSLRESGAVTDPVARRLLDVIYFDMLPGQADPDVQKRAVELESSVEQIFNTHRGIVGGKPATENDIREILAATSDSAAAKEAWTAYVQLGRKIEKQLHELVSLRNQTARELGFDNFFTMKLALKEIDAKELLTLFDELDELTRQPFAEMKANLDRGRAAKFGIKESELRPWHFGDIFFQEAPGTKEIGLDDAFAKHDPAKVAQAYFDSMGLPTGEIIARSDLYEREGKSPHAFSAHLDRQGDIRVLCNLKSNAYWMDTMVHELGHAVYDDHLGADVPFILRNPSHSITTEGIAMMFGAMTKDPHWLRHALGLPATEVDRLADAARKALRAEKLIFCRWTQVMVRFEHAMYGNPNQDLAKLWWGLKQKYQLLNPPTDASLPGYAAKMHIVGAPVYYHSYMMGDLFGAQVRHYIGSTVLGLKDPWGTSFYGSSMAGQYFKDRIFAPANLHSWTELTKLATGEPLTAKYFAMQFVTR